MSYEGYTQLVCAKGHKDSRDHLNDSPLVCECGEPFVWRNEVDDTNGDNLEDEVIFKQIVEAVYDTCAHCGHSRRVEEARYEIPKDKGRKIELEEVQRSMVGAQVGPPYDAATATGMYDE